MVELHLQEFKKGRKSIDNAWVEPNTIYDGDYLVNKPLQAAGMSADNVRGSEKNEHLAEKRSSEGKCEGVEREKIKQGRPMRCEIK